MYQYHIINPLKADHHPINTLHKNLQYLGCYADDPQKADAWILFQTEQPQTKPEGKPIVYILFEEPFQCWIQDPDALIYTSPMLLRKFKGIQCPVYYVPYLGPDFEYTTHHKDKGLHFRGSMLSLPTYHDRTQVLNDFRAFGYPIEPLPAFTQYDFNQYIKALQDDEFELVVFSEKQVISGRIFENALSGAINVIYITNPYQAEALYQIGFQHLKNCFLFSDYKDLIQLYALSEEQKGTLRYNAYETADLLTDQRSILFQNKLPVYLEMMGNARTEE